MQFMADRIAIGNTRGFQLYDIHAETWAWVPELRAVRDDPAQALLAKKLDGARPLGMYHVPDVGYLLCYDRVACYIDAAGAPVHMDRAFEWETRVVRTAYYHGYVLGFGTAGIEVRDARTGRIEQAVFTGELRLLSQSYGTEDPASARAEANASVVYVERVRNEGDVFRAQELVLA